MDLRVSEQKQDEKESSEAEEQPCVIIDDKTSGSNDNGYIDDKVARGPTENTTSKYWDSFVRCAVKSCKNNASRTSHDPSITYHPFPESEDLNCTWRDQCGLTGPTTDRSRVCSIHFEYGLFDDPDRDGARRNLHEKAVPTLFLPAPPQQKIGKPMKVTKNRGRKPLKAKQRMVVYPRIKNSYVVLTRLPIDGSVQTVLLDEATEKRLQCPVVVRKNPVVENKTVTAPLRAPQVVGPLRIRTDLMRDTSEPFSKSFLMPDNVENAPAPPVIPYLPEPNQMYRPSQPPRFVPSYPRPTQYISTSQFVHRLMVRPPPPPYQTVTRQVPPKQYYLPTRLPWETWRPYTSVGSPPAVDYRSRPPNISRFGTPLGNFPTNQFAGPYHRSVSTFVPPIMVDGNVCRTHTQTTTASYSPYPVVPPTQRVDQNSFSDTNRESVGQLTGAPLQNNQIPKVTVTRRAEPAFDMDSFITFAPSNQRVTPSNQHANPLPNQNLEQLLTSTITQCLESIPQAPQTIVSPPLSNSMPVYPPESRYNPIGSLGELRSSVITTNPLSYPAVSCAPTFSPSTNRPLVSDAPTVPHRPTSTHRSPDVVGENRPWGLPAELERPPATARGNVSHPNRTGKVGARPKNRAVPKKPSIVLPNTIKDNGVMDSIVEAHKRKLDKLGIKELEMQCCRICLDKTDLVSVFQKDGELNIATKLWYTTAIKVNKNDRLPKKICRTCTKTIHMAYIFRLICEMSEEKMQGILSASGLPKAPINGLSHRQPPKKTSVKDIGNVTSGLRIECNEMTSGVIGNNIRSESCESMSLTPELVTIVECSEDNEAMCDNRDGLTALPVENLPSASTEVFPRGLEKITFADENVNHISIPIADCFTEEDIARMMKSPESTNEDPNYDCLPDDYGDVMGEDDLNYQPVDAETTPTNLNRDGETHILGRLLGSKPLAKSSRKEDLTLEALLIGCGSETNNNRQPKHIEKPPILDGTGLPNDIQIISDGSSQSGTDSATDTALKRTKRKRRMKTSGSTRDFSQSTTKHRFEPPKKTSLVCQTCGCRFGTQTIYDAHVKDHKTRSCEHCHVEFMDAVARSKHLAMNNVTDPFPCGLCCKWFRATCAYNLHVVQHLSAENRQYSCDLCSENFMLKGVWLTHLRKHKIYRCFSCDASFGDYGAFRCHINIAGGRRLAVTVERLRL